MNTNPIPLTHQTEELVGAVRSADILVGIPSFNNAGTVGHVVRAVGAGLAKYFHGHRAVLVNADGGSTDDTLGVIRRQLADDDRIELLHSPRRNIPTSLNLALASAKEMSMSLPNTSTAQQLFNACAAQGGAASDHSAMVKALERLANFEVGQKT